MKYRLLGMCFLSILISCNKNSSDAELGGCNINQVYANNAKKVTIIAGVWGTASHIEGNCMPTFDNSNSSCKNCPVERTIKIYQYTLLSDAVTTDPHKVFYNSFNTPLVAEVKTDANGFFQVNLPAGHYSIVLVENGKLYFHSLDEQGGISPLKITSGLQNHNLTIAYKVVY